MFRILIFQQPQEVHWELIDCLEINKSNVVIKTWLFENLVAKQQAKHCFNLSRGKWKGFLPVFYLFIYLFILHSKNVRKGAVNIKKYF